MLDFILKVVSGRILAPFLMKMNSVPLADTALTQLKASYIVTVGLGRLSMDTAGKQLLRLLIMRTIRKKRESEPTDSLPAEKNALPAKWQEWIELNSAKLLNYARQQTRCEHDAEDVLQDSIARMWKLRDRCPNGVPAMSFAYQTIRCRAIDVGRQLDRRSAREDVTCQLLKTERGEWFEDNIVEKRENAVMLGKALRALPSKLREVIELKIWGGLTFAQIAKKVGAPLNTVTSRYRYALAHLRREVVPMQLDVSS